MNFLDSITLSLATGGAPGVLLPVSGDQSRTREFHVGKCQIVDLVCVAQPTTLFRLLASNLHDPQTGYSFRSLMQSTFNLFSLLPKGVDQYLESANDFTLEVLPAAGETDVYVSMALAYDHLPGTSVNFIGPKALKRRAKNLRTIAYDFVGTSTLRYTNAAGVSDGKFRYDRDYALLGANNSNLVGSTVRVYSKETGNLKLIIPMRNLSGSGINYFYDLSTRYDSDLIPVIPGKNISTMQCDVISPAGEQVDLFFVELESINGK